MLKKNRKRTEKIGLVGNHSFSTPLIHVENLKKKDIINSDFEICKLLAKRFHAIAPGYIYMQLDPGSGIKIGSHTLSMKTFLPKLKVDSVYVSGRRRANFFAVFCKVPDVNTYSFHPISTRHGSQRGL